MIAKSCAVVMTDEGARLTVTPVRGRRVVIEFHRTDADAVGATLVKAAREHKELHRPLDNCQARIPCSMRGCRRHSAVEVELESGETVLRCARHTDGGFVV